MKKYLSNAYSTLYKEDQIKIAVDTAITKHVQSQAENKEGEGFMALFSKRFRLRFGITIFLNIAQQLTGVNFLIFYSVQFFDEVSGNGETMSLVLGASNIVGAVMGTFMVSKFGRRFNLKYGALLQMISMYLLGLGIYLGNTLLPTIVVVVYMLSFAFSFGGTLTVYCTEIVPAVGVGVATAVQWLFASIVGKMVPLLIPV